MRKAMIEPLVKPQDLTEYEAFAAFAKAIVNVPKEEVDSLEVKQKGEEKENHRPKKNGGSPITISTPSIGRK